MTAVSRTTPAGRIVWGSLYDAQTKNYDGAPLVTKSGPNAGQPRVEYPFGLAIPKTPGVVHWASEAWGADIWTVGHAAFPQQAQRPDFAWKILDGDSQVPNKKGRKPCDQEGNPGHWIVRFSSGFAPNLYTLIGQREPVPLLEKNAIVPGYWVQVHFDVAGNDNPNNAGIYLNHKMVCLVAYGTPIVNGPDVASAGFGVAALPPGASLQPPANFVPPAPTATPGAGQPPPPPSAPAAAPAPSVPVIPNAAVLGTGAAPPPPPDVPARVMLPAAGGTPYEEWIKSGWTDALLVQHGKMAP